MIKIIGLLIEVKHYWLNGLWNKLTAIEQSVMQNVIFLRCYIFTEQCFSYNAQQRNFRLLFHTAFTVEKFLSRNKDENTYSSTDLSQRQLVPVH